MSTSRLSQNHPFLHHFDIPLTKDDFIKNFCAALKKNVMRHYPQQSDSIAAKKVAEQSWQHYLKVYDFFVNDHVMEGMVRLYSRTLQLEDLDKLYFNVHEDKCLLGSRHLYMTDYFANNLEEFQNFSLQNKDKARKIMNLPNYILTDPDSIFINYFFPLILRIGSTHYFQTMALIQLGVDVNQYSPHNGNTPLLLAVSKGWNHQDPDHPESKPSYPQQEIIKVLIEKNADVNAIHLANGMTALHLACLRGDDPEFITLLLQNGAKIDAKDFEGRTPLELMSLSYEATQEVINALTFTHDDKARITNAFGCKNYPEHRSWTATLPLKDERNDNQAKIKTILENAERSQKPSNNASSEMIPGVSLGQSSFTTFSATNLLTPDSIVKDNDFCDNCANRSPIVRY